MTLTFDASAGVVSHNGGTSSSYASCQDPMSHLLLLAIVAACCIAWLIVHVLIEYYRYRCGPAAG